MGRLIDAFLYFNEENRFRGRLEYLWDVVDYFVIVESNLTYSGNAKPLNFISNIEKYKKYLSKIIYYPYIVEEKKGRSAWVLEHGQRNYIKKALDIFNDDDIIIIGDLDEIPNRDILQGLSLSDYEILVLKQSYHYYSFNYQCVDSWHGSVWPGSIIATNKCLSNYELQNIRDSRWTNLMQTRLKPVKIKGMEQVDFIYADNGGWHLSYWGDPQKIKYKIESFSHQEYNIGKYTDVSHIQECIKQGKDLYGRDNTKIIKCDINATPKVVRELFTNEYEK